MYAESTIKYDNIKYPYNYYKKQILNSNSVSTNSMLYGNIPGVTVILQKKQTHRYA